MQIELLASKLRQLQMAIENHEHQRIRSLMRESLALVEPELDDTAFLNHVQIIVEAVWIKYYPNGGSESSVESKTL